MIVITLSKTPYALRGDLTRWCQEIQTGVYVGNVSARVRDNLWERVKKNIGNGEATIVYNTNNEQGFTFKTTRPSKKIVDLDGLEFVKFLSNPDLVQHGFSNAAKYHEARVAEKKYGHARHVSKTNTVNFAAVDIETTGLDSEKDKILSIGAVRSDGTEFYRVVKQDVEISKDIADLTGLTYDIVMKDGIDEAEALKELKEFVGDAVLVGYNFKFDLSFLNLACRLHGIDIISNRTRDLMTVVKNKVVELDSYKLKSVLLYYGINNDRPHNAVSDARAEMDLTKKLIENHVLKL